MTDEQLLAEHEATHPYPAGEVIGPCVCGSWPGGVCLKCRRIIERGTPPSAKPIEGRCQSCKTIFEFMRHEGAYVSDQRDGDAWKILCPVCSKEVWTAA